MPAPPVTQALAVSHASANGTTGAVPITLTTKPAHVGDIIVIWAYESGSSTSMTIADGLGGTWTNQSGNVDSGNVEALFVWTKRATSGDVSGTTYTVTASTFTPVVYGAAVVANGAFDTIGVNNAINGSGVAVNLCGTALNPGSSTDAVLAVFAIQPATTQSTTTPTGYTLLSSDTTGEASFGSGWMWTRALASSASVQPSTTPTFNAADGYLSFVMLFSPSSVNFVPPLNEVPAQTRRNSEAFLAALGVYQPGLAFNESFAPQPKSRAQQGFDVYAGWRVIGPTNLDTRFQPPLLDVDIRRRHHENVADYWDTGKITIGPVPILQKNFGETTDVDVRRRHHENEWLWSGYLFLGPDRQPQLPYLEGGQKQSRYNAEGWSVANGSIVSGPTPFSHVFVILAEPGAGRRHDGWNVAFTGRVGPPGPQGYIVPLESYGTRRSSAEAFAAWSGVSRKGPTPQYPPFIEPFAVKGRYNPEGWYWATGKITVGPSPTRVPTTQNIAATDTAVHPGDVVSLTEPQGFGLFIVPLFRPFY